MRLNSIRGGLMALAAGWLLCSCQSPGPRAPRTGSPLPRVAEDRLAFAEALAHYSEGLIHELHRDFALSLESYQHALELDPQNEELYFRLAMGLLHERRNADAVTAMEQLVQRNPRSTKALRWMALIYRAAEAYEKSVATYERWIDLEPSDPAPYIQLASLYAKAEEEDKALALLERATERVASPVDVLRAMAEIYLKRSAMSVSRPEEEKYLGEAARVFERIIEQNPDDAFALNKLGELYLANQQIDKAIAFYESVEEKHPDNLQVKEKLAESLLAKGEKARAVEVLKTIAKQQPTNPRVHFYLGELYQQMGDTEQAAESFRLAIEAEPTDPAGYLKLAILRMSGPPGEAARILLEGLQQLPGDETLLKTLAHVYFAEGDFAQASDYFGKALDVMTANESGSLNPNFFFNYAIATQRAGRLDESARFLMQAMEASTAFLDAYVQFAFRQDEEGVREQATEVLEHIADVRPHDVRIHYYLGMLRNFLKDYAGAIEAFDRAAQLAADSPERDELLNAQFYFWYGAAKERNGQFAEAEESFLKCIELSADHVEAFNYLAYMWAERGEKLDQALEFVNKALAQMPESGAFVDTLGWIYYRQGKYEAALTEIERAAALVPDDPTIMDHYGDVLLKLGDVDKALPKWKRSFVLDPENQQVAEKLTGHGVDLQPLRDEAETLAAERAHTEDAADQPKNVIVIQPPADERPGPEPSAPAEDATPASDALPDKGDLAPLPEPEADPVP